MRIFFLTCLTLALTSPSVFTQIINGQDTLYGNEWINFNQSYYKILVADDGIYRLNTQALNDAGFPIDAAPGSQLQLFHNGEEVPMHVTTPGIFTSGDYLEFFGEKNTSELDRYLFKHPDEEMMNPRYSLFTDSAAYFLTWSPAVSAPLRYETVANELVNLPAKEPYFLYQHVINNFSHFKKKQNAQGVSSSDFGPTEGFANNFSNSKSYNINPPAVLQGGPDAELYIRYSANTGLHQQQIILNNETLTTDEFYDYELRQLTFPISNATISAGAMSLKFQGLASNTDNHRVSNIVLTYPRQFSFSNQKKFIFEIEAASGVRYLEISNFSNAGGTPVLYDLTNRIRLMGSVSGNLVKIALPPSTVKRKLILVNDGTGIDIPGNPQPVDFIDYKNINAQFIILSNPRLYDDGNGNNRVQEYAEYRASAAGGDFSTVIVDIQQLYDQYAWGLNRHPLSIRNFSHFVKKHWEDVQYFFIIGKGREYPNVRTAAQLSNPDNATFYVPTFGVPGSDNLLLAGADEFTPVIPVGRIAVSMIDDIQIYLEKVVEFERNRDLPQTIEDRAWMKRVLHMGGGLTASEQSVIKNYLADMESTIENNKFGGEVSSFYKTSSDPIQISQTEQIFDIINAGTSIITFFGHSGVGTFDFSIDNPDNFKNEGKYPLILSLGCYSGNIHSNSKGISERFTFYKQKGAIAFGATSGLGYITSLHQFAGRFYKKIGNEMYGKGIGDVLQATIMEIGIGEFGINLVRQQFSYNGDPSLKLNPLPGPDYVVDASSVAIVPQRVNIQMDSFDIEFDVINLGVFTADSMQVEIIQGLPNGQTRTVVSSRIETPAFREKISFRIGTLGSISVGLNRFLVSLDVNDEIEELPDPFAENNNGLVNSSGVAGFNLFISDNSAVPVYPSNFAIVGKANVTLKATTTDPLVEPRTYLFEIDTTELFNSPLKLTYQITQSGGVLDWQPSMNWQDKEVYYWRISPDSITAQEGFNWSNSSFVYLEGSPNGWNQSHFFQYQKNQFTNLELGPDRRLKFISNFKDFNIKNALAINYTMPVFFVNNGFIGTYDGVPAPGGVVLLWLDSVNVYPQTNFPPGAGPYHHGMLHPNGWWVRYFMFNTTHFDDEPNGRKDLMNFLENVVSMGEGVIIATIQKSNGANYEPGEWENDSLLIGKTLFSILENEGAQLLRQTAVTGPLPYIFAYKKGSGKLAEGIANSTTDLLDISFGVPGNWDRGHLESPPIGPASAWNSVEWKSTSVINPESDTVSLSVYATFPAFFKDTLLYDNIEPGTLDLSNIDASLFPYLKLRFYSEDSLFKSSAQLDYWRVLYEGVPEFAFQGNDNFKLEKDTLQQGEELRLEFAVSNLSDFNSDSLLVSYVIQDLNNSGNVHFRRYQEILEQGNTTAQFAWDTRNSHGLQRLTIELNPLADQPELSNQNNYLYTTFFIEQDRHNPVLDVTFNGYKVLDGDLVSSRPLIRIEAIDENMFLPMDDTTTFKVFVQHPHEELPRQVYFSDEKMQFNPAQSGIKNTARIEYRPLFTTDGTYSLIVQANDVSGNQSGQYDYKVTFKVINKMMVSNVLNYPNPFSTSTKFVYTLTGSESPTHYKIQIMTVSGRIVKEITQDEIGPLQVGTHVTDYAWDGRDEFGDALANGVYLYRVVVENEGEEVEGFTTGANAYFKEGFGKMVILR